MRMHTKAQRLNKSPGKWQAQGLTPSFLLAYILGEYLQLDKQDQALCGPGISSIAFLYLRVNIRVLPNQAALTFSIAYDCVSAQQHPDFASLKCKLSKDVYPPNVVWGEKHLNRTKTTEWKNVLYAELWDKLPLQ